MKKLMFFVLTLSVVFAVSAQNGIIREMTGEVELKHTGSNVFVAARNGDTVAQDTIISTGFRSTAIVAIGSTTITVSPLTRLSLAQISSSSGVENLNVNLDAGRVRVEVAPPAGTRANTTIQSPTATASVRGTIFEMDTQSLNVIQGNVMFGGSDGLSVRVNAGGSSVVSSESGSAADPVEVAASGLAPSSPAGAVAAGEKIIVIPAAADEPGDEPADEPADETGFGITISW